MPLTNIQNGQPPLVLSRRDFDRIMKAAQILSPEEKERIRKDQEEARMAALKAAEDRRVEFETLASFHSTPDQTELDKENEHRNHHLIERAQELRMEQLPEIKRLNEAIIQAKCHAIRDAQVEDKEKRL